MFRLRHFSVHGFFLMPIASSLSPAEDPRKIDSTWHIPTGGKKRELGLSQLTRVMNAVWEKMGVEENGEVIVRLAFRFRYPQGLGYCFGSPASGIYRITGGSLPRDSPRKSVQR